MSMIWVSVYVVAVTGGSTGSGVPPLEGLESLEQDVIINKTARKVIHSFLMKLFLKKSHLCDGSL